MMNLTQLLLKTLLHYNPETGTWTWIKPLSRNIKPGFIAGSTADGRYWRIQIAGTGYQSGRLAWLYMTGNWPQDQIDHINRDSYDDRWINLREATCSQNNFNREFNSAGHQGVNKFGDKWKVRVGPYNYVGTYSTLAEAIIARDAAAYEMGGAFAFLNSERV